MADIEDRLEMADAHMGRAEEELEAVAQRIRKIVEEEARPEVDIHQQGIGFDVFMDQSRTVTRLNKELPESLYATAADGEVRIQSFDRLDLATELSAAENVRQLIAALEDEWDDGAPVEVVLAAAAKIGLSRKEAKEELTELKRNGEVYEGAADQLRTV